MNFASFNKERVFDVDTSNYGYKSLADLYNPEHPEIVYQLEAVYIGTKSAFDDETPQGAIPGTYVNFPQHQLSEIKAMLDSRAAINAIRNGEAGFRIEKYYQKRYHKDCYRAVWCDYHEDEVDD